MTNPEENGWEKPDLVLCRQKALYCENFCKCQVFTYGIWKAVFLPEFSVIINMIWTDMKRCRAVRDRKHLLFFVGLDIQIKDAGASAGNG